MSHTDVLADTAPKADAVTKNDAVHSELCRQLAELSEKEMSASTQELAARFGVSEYQLVAALPEEMAVMAHGSWAQSLLEELTGWGPLTTIVESEGSIFEFKGAFPAGKPGHGYFNLYSKEGTGLHGHLLLSQVSHIALLAKPFMGKASYSLQFFAANGRTMFKVYLGRDKLRQLLPEQVALFEQLRVRLIAQPQPAAE